MMSQTAPTPEAASLQDAIQRPRFHLAFPVTDLAASRRFFTEMFGCAIGRQSDRWMDFNFFEHQVVAHLVEQHPGLGPTNKVDGKDVPAFHFGLIMEWEEWHRLRDHLVARNAPFIIEPYIRFAEQIGEQATMFVSDPSGNALEFKAFKDMSLLFDPDFKPPH